MQIIDVGALLDRIPRPDRHGFIGIFFSLTILYAIVGPIPAGVEGSALCEIMPWKCQQQVDSAEQHEPAYRYRVVHLVFAGKSSGKAEPICACHLDYKVSGSEAIHHIFTGENPPTCDSEYPPTDARKWMVNPGWCRLHDIPPNATCSDLVIDGGDGNHKMISGVSLFRWHCTSDSRYLKPLTEPFESFEQHLTHYVER